jgi:hypothetical protein
VALAGGGGDDDGGGVAMALGKAGKNGRKNRSRIRSKNGGYDLDLDGFARANESANIKSGGVVW